MGTREDCGPFGCWGVFVNEEAMNVAMFWWVEALMSAGVQIPVTRAIETFMKKNNLTEDQLNVESAKMKYSRFQKDLRERLKNG